MLLKPTYILQFQTYNILVLETNA